MGLDYCCGKTVKYILIFLNFLSLIAGGVILGFSAYFMVKNGSDLAGIIKTVLIAVIALSSFMIFTSFFGCCGAITSSCCMLGIYVFMMLIMLGGDIYGIVYVYTQMKYSDYFYKLSLANRQVVGKMFSCDFRDTMACVEVIDSSFINPVKYVMFGLIAFIVLVIALTTYLSCFNSSRENEKRRMFTMPFGMRRGHV